MNLPEKEQIRPLIVIPVYNHGGTLRDVVARALDVCDNVLVVDDGSTDVNTREVINGLSARLIRHEKNRERGSDIEGSKRGEKARHDPYHHHRCRRAA